MLHEIAIENLGVIESARVDLGPGLTCVTGETGAGKTMVLTGLGLILGSKSVRATVRTGADSALAEAIVDVAPGSWPAERLADAGADLDDDGTVIVSRSVGATSRSRAVVGGRTVPQAVLAEVAEHWVTVHGQSDQARLRSAAEQRTILDGYADHGPLLDAYAEAWQEWRDARERLEALESGAEAARLEAVRMRDDLDAIDAVAPEAGEDAALAREIEVLEHSEQVRAGVAGAREAIDGDAEVTLVVAAEAARRSLAEATRHDPDLEDLERRLADVAYGAADVAHELSSYLDRMDADPARLHALQSRRADLNALMRRIGADLDGVLAYRERAAAAVAQDDTWDETVAERRAAEAKAREEVERRAAALSQSRRDAAGRLAVDVNAELAGLAMADATFTVELTATEPRATGADEVAMLLSAHPGAPHRPVAEAASGGELSRIMLAIEVSLARHAVSPGHTFVFDEVDAGVGGRAAIAVGRRLAELARTHQVLVVTHLAQVAAHADRHVVVAKSSDGAVTRAQVHEVDGEARVEELARLLSGHEDSKTALAHARELLEASRVAP